MRQRTLHIAIQSSHNVSRSAATTCRRAGLTKLSNAKSTLGLKLPGASETRRLWRNIVALPQILVMVLAAMLSTLKRCRSGTLQSPAIWFDERI